MRDLLNGIAVIIDDEIDQESASINELINQIKSENIPCYMTRELPPIETIKHLGYASLIILDWRLNNTGISGIEGVRIPSNLDEDNINETIIFLKELTRQFFAPIFIFTNDDKATVQLKLEENGLFQKGKTNVILVKKKDELKDTLFKEIEDWIKKNESIYVLKKWEQEYQSAKNKMFLDFYNRSPNWPNVLWNTFEEDKMNEVSMDLAEVIERNLYSRMTPFRFESDLLKGEPKIEKDEMCKLLEGTRFIKKDQLNPKDKFTGDLFKVEEDGSWPYRLNIRAQCDLRDSNPELYCLKGRVVKEEQINNDNGVEFAQGEFREKKNQAIVPFLDDGKIIEFSFRDLKIEKWNKLKEHRVGRVLYPYINRIQQLYSLYFQRIGLPRTPEQAVQKLEIETSFSHVAPTREMGEVSS